MKTLAVKKGRGCLRLASPDSDYALQEYGLTPKEAQAAEKRILAELKSARARGELTPFLGNEDDSR